MNREQIARENHYRGYSCSTAVYRAFFDMVSGEAPFPKSEGGKCGAVLAAEKALRQLGLSGEDFDTQFQARFHSLKCVDLRRAGFSCNDLVGISVHLTEDIIRK